MGNNRHLTPSEIVGELDKFIIGQDDAKRAVAIAIRNRWRRLQLQPEIREEVAPKNIIMVGPTGGGQNGDCPAFGDIGGSTVYQGGGIEVYRGWLCGSRRGKYGSGSVGAGNSDGTE